MYVVFLGSYGDAVVECVSDTAEPFHHSTESQPLPRRAGPQFLPFLSGYENPQRLVLSAAQSLPRASAAANESLCTATGASFAVPFALPRPAPLPFHSAVPSHSAPGNYLDL